MAALQVLDGDSEPVRGRQLVADAVADLRDVLSGDRDVFVASVLEGRLRGWCEQLAYRHPATFRLTVDAERPVARLVYDAARELLTNSARHAEPSSIWCHIEDDVGQGSTVCVVDDGWGMPADHHDGLGLGVLRRRVKLAGGSLQHSSSVDGGTVAHVRLPREAAGVSQSGA